MLRSSLIDYYLHSIISSESYTILLINNHVKIKFVMSNDTKDDAANVNKDDADSEEEDDPIVEDLTKIDLSTLELIDR